MCVGVTLWFGCGGVVSVYRLKHSWPVHVECGGWGLMTAWNRVLVSPGLCSGMSRAQDKPTPCSKPSLTPNPHIPHEQTSSASACIRIPHHHNQTTT